MARVCQGCGKSLEESEFPVRKDRSNRLRPYCKSCARDAQRYRYENHKKTLKNNTSVEDLENLLRWMRKVKDES